MKILKPLACTLAVTTLTLFGTLSTKATIGQTRDISTLNISLTISTNNFTETDTSVKETIKSSKMVTKDLLNLFQSADFANATFPSGSKIVAGWDWHGDVLVVDKTGTNIIFDASTNSPGYCQINFRTQVGSENFSQTRNATSYEQMDIGSFYLHDENLFSIDLPASGPSTFSVTQNYKGDTFSSYSHTEKLNFYGAGGLFDGFGPAYISGTVSGSGSGKGSTVISSTP